MALPVQAAISALPAGRWLLAVSGGRDSMVLLDAMSRARQHEIAAVATFDHRTGAAARAAVALVEREAGQRGLAVVVGEAPAGTRGDEAGWRAARLGFLEAWALELDAQVATGHTRDDQVETVVQRLLRDAGPRGLAAMKAAGVRPLLAVTRSEVAAYASAHALPFIEDPSNRDLRHQRNRVRLEIIPALEAAVPGFSHWCWELGTRAAEWRAGLDELAGELVRAVVGERGASVVIALEPVREVTEEGWRILWPALAARAGVVMDRRGIERAARWAPRARRHGTIQLSNGARITFTGTTFVITGNDARP